MKDELVFDAEDAIIGRLAALTAGKLLTGYTVVIVNAEKSVFSGDEAKITARYQAKRDIQQKADPDKSPKWPRRPDLLLKRVIFGMLPTSRRNTRKQALRDLRCYLGVPEEYAGKGVKPVKTVQDLHRRSVTLLKVSRNLGYAGKQR